MIPGSANPLLLTSAAAPGPAPSPEVDNIEHSVRFNSADSAYLSWTPSGAGNGQIFTHSFWTKKTTGGYAFGMGGTSSSTAFYISLFDTISVLSFGTFYKTTSAVFRDYSAWYHVVVAVDTTLATASDRIKIYVNGVQITDFSVDSAPTQNRTFNDNSTHVIGDWRTSGSYNGYIANYHKIDGQALTPSSFGFTDSNGVWQPKAYSGSYGTNGYHLDFADTSSATALGNDVSGNNNDFTPSNLVAGPAYTANSFSTEFDGSGDYLTAASSDFALGTGDFTIEFWLNSNDVSSTTQRGVFQTSDTAGGLKTTYTTGVLISQATSGSGSLRANVLGTNFGSSGAVITTNTWHHVALTRESGVCRLFVDGSLINSATVSGSIDGTNLCVGGYLNTSFLFDGEISNFRIIKGRALYTAAFTPPSTALTATDDTVLLTCQDATVRDNSNIGHDVTASGDVAVVNEGPFNGYSGNFDGSGDGLATPDITLGSNDYTLELWVYLTATGTARALYGHVLGNTPDRAISYFLTASDQFGFQHRLGDGSYINAFGSTSLKVNTWYHLAAVRVNDDYYLYVNGVLDASNTTAGANHTYYKDPAPHYIGYNRTAVSDFLGYISNVRLTVGQALYTSNFTPPTADLTTTSQGATASNVKLLTCQNSTFIDNSPSAHTITANGNAHPVSVNPHTDKYSVTFDVLGDYLSFADSADLEIGTDTTIELFLKFNTIPTGATYIFGKPNGYWLAYDSTAVGGVASRFTFSINNGSSWSGTTNASGGFLPVVDTWYHIAAVKEGTSTKLYVDGTLYGSGTFSGTPADNSTDIQLPWSGNALDGKISNLRITKGQALYTSNFLPSKEDLTTTSQGATASNVKLLTCQSYKIQDNSPSARTITVVNDAAPSSDAPFVTSGAGYFDGTGDYLTVTDNNDFDLGSGDFTLEGWVNLSNTTGTQSFVCKGTGTGNQASYAIQHNGTNWLYYLSDNGSTWGIASGVTMGAASANAWYHLALVRNGSTITPYVNGVAGTSTTSSATVFNGTAVFSVGSNDIGSQLITGKISNVRLSKGLARYTANFTPPTEDFDPTDQDTTFLALQGNTLDDLAGDHAVSALGNAATSTVSPFEPVDGSDAMLDSPTNYGSGDTVRGNFCTLNPVNKAANGGSTNGNVEYLSSGGRPNAITGTMAVSSGKWFYESTATNNAYSSGNPVYQSGFVDLDIWDGVFDNPMVRTAGSGFYGYSHREGYKYINGTGTSFATGAAIGDVIGLALDLDAGELEIYKNGTSLGVLATGLSGTFIPCVESDTTSTGQAATVNFGQQPFKYPVAGYKAWCSTNLPTPAVADGSTAMDVKLYNGNGSPRTISGFGFSPDLVWIKSRAAAYTHSVNDTVRGADRQLFTNLTSAEGTDTNQLTSFTSDGFTLGDNSTGTGGVNYGTGGYAAWTWDAGSNSNKTYSVKVVSDSGNKYRFDDFGTSAVTLDLEEGSTYIFDQSDSSNSGHPLRFSTTSDGTHNSGTEYTTGVTTAGTPGSAGAYTQIVVASGTPTLYYYCSAHSGMGGQADTNSTAGASNFDGSVQSVVRVNPTAGISIATFTGSGAGSFGHGLTKTPAFVITKKTAASGSWNIYHESLGVDQYLAFSTAAAGSSTGFWSGTNSSVVGFSSNNNCSVGDNVAYCFAPVEGFSAFGSYTGNGSADGPFVYTGFRPRWILIKSSSNTETWNIYDTTRGTYNVLNMYLQAQSSAGEGTNHAWDILSNGFKLRLGGGGGGNTNGATYIYAAFAEHPFSTSRAR